MGGHLNAYTSRDQTVYFAKVFNSDMPQAVNILSDIVQNSTLSHENIERERLVILREQEEVEKQMDEVIFDHLHATAFQGTSLGRTILGPKENIQSLKRNDLVEFVKNNYTADRMVLAAAGGVQHDSLVKLAEQYLASLPRSAEGALDNFKNAEFTGSEVRIREDDMPNAHIALAVEGVSWSSPDYFPLLIAQSIMGSYDRTLSNSSHLSSSLATRIHQYGLASSYAAFNTCYSDTGLFGIYMTAPQSACGNLDDLLYCVQSEWMRLCFDIKDVEFARAKQGLKTMMLLGLDGTTAVCEEIGRQMLTLGRHMTPYEVDKAIDSVTKEQVMAVAKEYIYDKDIAVASIGPVEKLPDYLVLRNHMDWNRV
jgi:processing peptidase subunit beta